MSDNIKNLEKVPFYKYTPPSWDRWFMKQVYLVAEKSKDPSTKIGAVLVRDNHIISSGYNGFPIGVKDKESRYNDRQEKYRFVVHAEDNAVLAAARFGISTKDAILYTQSVPCCECTKSVIQGGIKEIIIHKQWQLIESSRWDKSTSLTMFKEAGIPIIVIDAVLDVDGYTDGNRVRI